MAWTTFPTLTDGQVLTGAHMQLIRDNFAETAPAKATTAGRFFVATGTNSIAERTIDSQTISTSQTTTSTSYADLATVGPQVTATTGTKALVFWEAQMSCSVSNTSVRSAIAVSGATTIGASDSEDLYIDGLPAGQQIRAAAFQMHTALTGGSNTFKMQYKVGAGTGTYLDRQLVVMAL